MSDALETIEQRAIEAEVNATIKLVMSVMEELASLPPELAAQPMFFNHHRHTVIRKIWNLSKECILYGAGTVQPEQSE